MKSTRRRMTQPFSRSEAEAHLLILCLSICLLICGCFKKQEHDVVQPPRPTFPVVGTVQDMDDGKLLAGAVVSVTDSCDTTDSEGRFQLLLPVGDCAIRVELTRYTPLEESLKVEGLDTTWIGIELMKALEVLAVHSAPGPYPSGVAWDGSSLWSCDYTTNLIYRHDPEDLSVLDSYASPGSHPRGLVWDGVNLWVSSCETRKIYRMSSNMTVEDSFALHYDFPYPPFGDEHPTNDLTYDGNHFWGCQSLTDIVYKHDPISLTPVDSFSMSFPPLGLAWNGGSLLISGVSTVYGFNPESGSVVCHYGSDRTTRQLEWDGTTLWICGDWTPGEIYRARLWGEGAE